MTNKNISIKSLFTCVAFITALAPLSHAMAVTADESNTNKSVKQPNIVLLFSDDAGYADFGFHGVSGSAPAEITEAIGYGVIKMNIDTDTQWASWQGVATYYQENKAYLQSQIGNPLGEDNPNKKYYDPRVWLRKVEQSMAERLVLSFQELNCLDRYK